MASVFFLIDKRFSNQQLSDNVLLTCFSVTYVAPFDIIDNELLISREFAKCMVSKMCLVVLVCNNFSVDK